MDVITNEAQSPVQNTLDQIEGKLKALNAMLQQRMDKRMALTELLQDIAVAANQALSVNAALQFAVNRIGAYTGWPVGHVYSQNSDSPDGLSPTDIWYLPSPEQFETFRQITAATPLAYGDGLPGQVLATGEPIWITDVTQEPGFKRTSSTNNLGVKAGFAFPVLMGRQVVAVLEFFSGAVVEPDESLLEVMKLVGAQLGRVAERQHAEDEIRALNADLEQRVVERTAQLEAANQELKAEISERKLAEAGLQVRARQQFTVAKLGQQALGGIGLPELMDEAVQQVTATLEVEYGKVLELLPAENIFVVRAGLGWRDGVVGQATIEVSPESQAGYTLLFDQPVIVTSLPTETRFKGMPLLHEHGVVSGMTVVIPGCEQPYGVLGAYTAVQRNFTQDDASFLQAVANVLAEAIERKQVEEALKLSRDQNAQLYEDAKHLNAKLEERVKARTLELQAANIQLEAEIAERKRVEIQIREHEQQLAEAQRIAHLGSWAWDIETNKLTWSDELYHIYGLTPADFKATYEGFLRKVHPSDRNRVRQVFEKAFDNPQPFKFEHRIVRADGVVRILSGRAQVLVNETGWPLKIVGTAQDITERQQAEEALRENEARIRAIFEGATIGMALIDHQKQIVESNPVLRQMLNYTRDELRRIPFTAFIHPADVRPNEILYQELILQKRDQYQLETRWLSQDQRLIWGRLTVSPVRGSDGQLHFAIAMIEDITAQKEIQAELVEMQRRLIEGREAERLHLAQELHDGPLQDLYGMGMRLNELETGLTNETSLSRMAAIQATVQRLTRILRAICGELRPPTLAPFGLEKAIRSHAESFRKESPGITIEMDLTPDGQTLPEQIRLALFRIYQHAMANISQHAQAQHIAIRFKLEPHQIILEIEDDGQGFVMPRRQIELVRQGHYGLAGAIERAEAIGGSIDITSSPGQGTLLQVIVPRSNGQESEPSIKERPQLYYDQNSCGVSR